MLLLTTAREEVRFVDELVDGVLAQSRLPDRWIIVDDGSADETFDALAQRVGGVDWVTLLRRDCQFERVPDRLATAAVPQALNWALASVDWDDFTHIGKIDADVALPPRFIERLLGEFAADRELGMIGGVLTELRGGRWRPVPQPATHAPPPARLYTRDCFEACGGFRERLAWDIIDAVYARMRGFSTRVSNEVPVRHMRIHGSADGTLRGRARHGRSAWIAHYPLSFILLRSLKVAGRSPPEYPGWRSSGATLRRGCGRCLRLRILTSAASSDVSCVNGFFRPPGYTSSSGGVTTHPDRERTPPRTLDVLGVRVDLVDKVEAPAQLEHLHDRSFPAYVSYVNPHTANVPFSDYPSPRRLRGPICGCPTASVCASRPAPGGQDPGDPQWERLQPSGPATSSGAQRRRERPWAALSDGGRQRQRAGR